MQSVDRVWYQSSVWMKILQSGFKEGTEKSAKIAKKLIFSVKKEMVRAGSRETAHEARTLKMVGRSTDQETHY